MDKSSYDILTLVSLIAIFFSFEENQTRSSVRHVNTNPNDLDMAKFLQMYALNHRSSMIKPRGLSNRNNWCFVNAILQAIVACPPFYNLMKSLPNDAMKRFVL